MQSTPIMYCNVFPPEFSEIGSTCSADADCNGVIHNSQCDQSQCSCLPGYDAADGGTACTIKGGYQT